MNQLDILETPSQAASRNAQIGSQWASAFLGAYNASTARRREDERWAEGKPLRDAQLATENAQLEGLVAQNKLRSIAVANQSSMQAKMADFAGLSGDIAAKGWEPTDKGKLYEFLRKNPEFYGSPFHQQLEAGFSNAQKARDDEERWRTAQAVELTQARIRQETSSQEDTARMALAQLETKTKLDIEKMQQEGLNKRAADAVANRASSLSPEDRLALNHELTTIRASINAVDPKWVDEQTEKVYRKFGVRGATRDLTQPETAPQPNRRKIVLDKSGRAVIEGQPQAAAGPEPIGEASDLAEDQPEPAAPESELTKLQNEFVNAVANFKGTGREKENPIRLKFAEELAQELELEPMSGWDRIGASSMRKNRDASPGERVLRYPKKYDQIFNSLPEERKVAIMKRVLGK